MIEYSTMKGNRYTELCSIVSPKFGQILKTFSSLSEKKFGPSMTTLLQFLTSLSVRFGVAIEEKWTTEVTEMKAEPVSSSVSAAASAAAAACWERKISLADSFTRVRTTMQALVATRCIMPNLAAIWSKQSCNSCLSRK